MAKPAKAKRSEVVEIDGITCVVFVGADSARREVSVAIPAGALQQVFAQAAEQLHRHQSKAQQIDRSGYTRQLFREGEPLKVEGVLTKSGQRVALLFHPGMATEIAYSLSPETARQVGERMIQLADEALSPPDNERAN